MMAVPAENPGIALVRSAFEAFGRRDLDALIELTDDEVELFAPSSAPVIEGRCYRGHEGIARYLHDVDKVWARFDVVPERFREVGNHVVSLGRVRAQTRDGLAIDHPAAWVWEVRGGKLCWGCVYADPGEPFMGLSLTPDDSAAAAEPLSGGGSPSARVA